jgi:glycosyltransferase involved in cell wall biosynthesis
VFALYHHCFNPDSRLILIGNLQAVFTGYLESLQRVAAACGVGGRVVFATSVSPAELRSYYLLADAFLCVSEHEGFCVPLVEAMCCRVPIVAWGTTAVPETLGGCALVWSDFDEGNLAESIHACVERGELSRGLRRMGRGRYEACYANDILAKRLLEYTAVSASHTAPAGAS